MGILVDENTRVMVQGITGREGSFHARNCMAYGANVVAGVTPGRGGSLFEDKVPVFNSVEEAVAETAANMALIFVPPPFAADAIVESADAGVPLIACITEGVPALDMVRVARYLEDQPVRLIGPNCPGLINPGARCKVGIMPGRYSPAGTHRHRLSQRHSDLRSRGATHRPGHRTVDLRRNWGRPHHRHKLR